MTRLTIDGVHFLAKIVSYIKRRLRLRLFFSIEQKKTSFAGKNIFLKLFWFGSGLFGMEFKLSLGEKFWKTHLFVTLSLLSRSLSFSLSLTFYLFFYFTLFYFFLSLSLSLLTHSYLLSLCLFFPLFSLIVVLLLDALTEFNYYQKLGLYECQQKSAHCKASIKHKVAINECRLPCAW